MAHDESRDVSVILTPEHLRLITKEHLLKPEALNDPDRLRSFVQSMVDKAIGFPEDACTNGTTGPKASNSSCVAASEFR